MAAGVVLAADGPALLSSVPSTKGESRIRQSVSRWCYQKYSLEELCVHARNIGLEGIDLLHPEEFNIPGRYGLTCTMGYVGAGEIPSGWNRMENHSAMQEAMRKNVPLAAKGGVPNVITFAGSRVGISDEQGAENAIIGLNQAKKIVEDNNVTLCLELLNSKIDHHDYMADHTSWGVRVMEEVNSPHVKLLYDIYHMQIMEGDLIRTIRENIRWIGHFHTGGVPGRHELDSSQEIQWQGVMKAIAESGFQGYVAHEFLPTGDPFKSLDAAVQVCSV
jgi:hydroxypyruvate isomerase